MVDWIEKPIGDLLEFKNGLNKGKAYFGHGIPIINYMDVYKKNGIYRHEIHGRVDLTKQEIKRFEIRKGDVFFTRTSETPEEVGKSCVLLDDVTDGVFSGFVLRGRPKTDELDIEYCKYCFQTAHVRKEIVSSCTYTTRALTNGKRLSKICIPIPPRREQHTIASVLSDTDSYISALERLIAKKRDIKQGAMQELLRPKEGWKQYHLRNVKKGTMITSTQLNPGNIPVIAGGKAPAYYHSEANFAGNTITISASGASAGYVWYHLEPIFASDCSVITEHDDYDLTFIYYVLLVLQNDIYAKQTGGAQPHIHPSQIEELSIFLPQDIVEQKRIAKILSEMDEEINLLMARLNKMKLIKQGMMEQLLTGKIRLGVKSNA